jgi:hypothetical protein
MVPHTPERRRSHGEERGSAVALPIGGDPAPFVGVESASRWHPGDEPDAAVVEDVLRSVVA